MSYWQTRTPDLRIPTRGTRAPAQPSWMNDVRALSLVLKDGCALSHSTAAAILGLPIPDIDPRPLHVTVPLDSARGKRGGVVWHRADLTGLRIKVKGLTVTGPWRTWIDLGPMLALPDLVAVTDVLLRRRHLAVGDLQVPRGVRGARLLRRAADLADSRSRSARESQLRVHLHEAGLPTPDVNADIYIDGGWAATGDLVWWEFKLVLEYDGEDHATLDQRHQDVVTRDALRADGWFVKVVTARHFQRLRLTIDEIADLLLSRGWSG